MRFFWLFVLLFIASPPALAGKFLAVLEFRGSGLQMQVLQKLSDQSRDAALHTLPKDQYAVMTRENMMMVINDMGKDSSCMEGGCEVEIGRNIGADFIITGDILQLGDLYMLTLKLYETGSGRLLEMNEIRSKEIIELIDLTKKNSTTLLQKGLNIAEPTSQTSKNASRNLTALKKKQQSDIDDDVDVDALVQKYKKKSTEGMAPASFVEGADILFYQDRMENDELGTALVQDACKSGYAFACAFEQRVINAADDFDIIGSFLEPQCEQNEAYACIMLGWLYTQNTNALGWPSSTAQDPYLGDEQFVRACALGEIRGCIERLRYPDDFPIKLDAKERVKQAKKLCGKQQHMACDVYGWLIQGGKGVKKNPRKAMQIFKKSCDTGYHSSCTSVGQMYGWNDSGIKVDLRKAVSYYKKGCKEGERAGCDEMADAYNQGLGIRKDTQKAKKWYKKSCESFSMRSCWGLGQQKWTEKKYKTAISYFQKSCSGGYSWSCQTLGNVYFDSEGARKNHKKALTYYRKSCDKFDLSESCNSAGIIYHQGSGVTQNFTQAVHYFRSACEHTSPYMAGCSNLGIMFEEGLGVRKNPAKAKKYYQKACKGGYEAACDQL
ncbi:MAG: hypothetical protein VX278_00870 [Myxococcota bacterium]|nr:hypothetical protein [Myxococcota bacterium]